MNKNENARSYTDTLSETIGASLRDSGRTTFGVLDTGFLSQNVSILAKEPPICVHADESLAEAMHFLKANEIGCVLVVDKSGQLCGIFSERDYMSKIFGNPIDLSKTLISEYMTNIPISVTPDTHIAFALNLMSQLGFRHLPVVDQDNAPVAILSVRDIMDYIVQSFVDDLMNIDLPSI